MPTLQILIEKDSATLIPKEVASSDEAAVYFRTGFKVHNDSGVEISLQDVQEHFQDAAAAVDSVSTEPPVIEAPIEAPADEKPTPPAEGEGSGA